MAGDERVVTARGRAVPRIGLGTWQLHGRAARDGVADALALLRNALRLGPRRES